MKAILKRELKSYFASPVGYVCVAVLLALYSFFFYSVMIQGTTSIISQVYSTMFMYCMMIIPLITMRSFTDDIKNKTDQAYLTAPISISSVVIGKFLAAFAIYFLATTLGHFNVLAMSFFSSPPWGIIAGNYIATLLYGAAMIAIGIFISSLTQSQVIAAIGTFAIAVTLIFIDGIGYTIGNPIAVQIISWISFYTRYSTFTIGIFSVPNTVFFLSVVAIFIFLTTRKIESRRWS